MWKYRNCGKIIKDVENVNEKCSTFKFCIQKKELNMNKERTFWKNQTENFKKNTDNISKKKFVLIDERCNIEQK